MVNEATAMGIGYGVVCALGVSAAVAGRYFDKISPLAQGVLFGVGGVGFVGVCTAVDHSPSDSKHKTTVRSLIATTLPTIALIGGGLLGRSTHQISDLAAGICFGTGGFIALVVLAQATELIQQSRAA